MKTTSKKTLKHFFLNEDNLNKKVDDLNKNLKNEDDLKKKNFKKEDDLKNK